MVRRLCACTQQRMYATNYVGHTLSVAAVVSVLFHIRYQSYSDVVTKQGIGRLCAQKL